MKRRTFLAAVAPLMAVAGSASAQNPLGQPATEASLGGVPTNPRSPGTSTSPAEAPAPASTDNAKRAKGPTEITSREAMLDNRNNLATFSGEVEVKNPEYNVTCDKLTVHLKKQKGKAGGDPKPAEPRPIGSDEPAAKGEKEKKDDAGGIERAIAEGNVTIVQDRIEADGKKQRYFGKARKAVFDPDKRTCVLTGWPKISQAMGEELSREVVATQESTVITLDQAGIIKVDGQNRVRLNDMSAFDQKPR